jgi:hypothetical protein
MRFLISILPIILINILLFNPCFAQVEKNQTPNNKGDSLKVPSSSRMQRDRLFEFDDVVRSKTITSKNRVQPNASFAIFKERDGRDDRVIVDYTHSWVNFSVPMRLPMQLSGNMSAAIKHVDKNIDLRPLQKPIIDKTVIDKKLKAKTKKFISLTNNDKIKVLWDPDSDFLGLEVWKKVDLENNKCVRAIINLRDGDINYRDVACRIY